MKNIWNSFEFNSKERRGVIVLLILLAVLIICVFLVNKFYGRSDLQFDLIVFEGGQDSSGGLEPTKQTQIARPLAYRLSEQAEIPMFEFDPNDLPVTTWKKLGLTDRQISVIKNYEAKGGRFYRKEDLKKIYSISESWYRRAEPFIRLNEIKNPNSKVKEYGALQLQNEKSIRKEENNVKSNDYDSKFRIDINTADTTAWKRLRGIGSVFSNRIVKFRENLGGFHDVNQLSEVYGISSELFGQIKPYLILENNSHKRIEINKISASVLAAHPYVNKKQAESIVNYRSSHGNFRSVADLRKMMNLNEEFFVKMEKYLDFSQ